MKRLSRRIPSRLENVAPFIQEALEAFKELALADRDVFSLKLCLEEALTNAIRHGSKLDPALSVAVEIELGPDKIVMSVRDQGDGFDEARLADPTRGARAGEPGGRGVFLIKKLMDEVEYFDGGRGVRMAKRL